MRKRIRICALEGCDKDISNLRVDAKYCCATHRATGVRQSKQKIVSALDIKTPQKSPKDLMMQSITPVKECAVKDCKFPAKGRGSYCSDLCRKRHNREINKDSRKSQVYEKTRTKKEFSVAENYTRLYNSLQTHDERLKMIRGALLYASTSPKDKNKYTEDIMMLRRTFRSPILSRGVGNAQVLIKKVGNLFPMYVAGYLQAVYHCTAKEFLNDPDMTRAADESAWDGKPLSVENKNIKEDKIRDFDDDIDLTDKPASEVDTQTRIWSLNEYMPENDTDNGFTMISARNVKDSEPVEEDKSLSEIIQDKGSDYYNNLIDTKTKSVRTRIIFE